MASDANTRRLDCGDAVDIISDLPSDLLDLILKRLLVDCVGRMCILSKTWRGKWEMHPHLVFDDLFLQPAFSEVSFQK